MDNTYNILERQRSGSVVNNASLVKKQQVLDPRLVEHSHLQSQVKNDKTVQQTMNNNSTTHESVVKSLLVNQLQLTQLFLDHLNSAEYQQQEAHHNNSQHGRKEDGYPFLQNYLENILKGQSIIDITQQELSMTSTPAILFNYVPNHPDQPQQQQPTNKNRHDPIKYISDHLILRQIFSFLTTKKESLKLMSVSKTWMEEVPGLTTYLWKFGMQLNGSNHALENSLLHQCLGPHVKSVEFYRFNQQDDLFKMMEIVKSHNCTEMISICFNECLVNNLHELLDALAPLAQSALILEFEHHKGTALPIPCVIKRYPHVEHFEYSTGDNQEQTQDGIDITLLQLNPSQIPINNLLTNLTIGAGIDCMGRVVSLGSKVNCTSDSLSSIIKQAPFLETLILSHVGKNIDFSVIHAITELKRLKTLGLLFELDHEEAFDSSNNKEQQRRLTATMVITPIVYMGLQALFAKHASLGARSPLAHLTLNVVDDIIMYQIARISTLNHLNVTDTLQHVTEQGILTFAQEISSPSSCGFKEQVVQLALHRFDLRNYRFFGRLSHLPKLETVDFSDCYVQKDGYKTFIDQSPNLQHVIQPLFDLDDQDEQAVTSILNNNDNGVKTSPKSRRVSYKLLHHGAIPISEYCMNDRRNEFIVVTEEMEKSFEMLNLEGK